MPTTKLQLSLGLEEQRQGLGNGNADNMNEAKDPVATMVQMMSNNKKNQHQLKANTMFTRIMARNDKKLLTTKNKICVETLLKI